MKWTERWIARAQRKADLRADRFLRHEEGVRAGTEPPGFLDRMESRTAFHTGRFETWGMLSRAYANERCLNQNWPSAVRPDGAALADAWRTWVTDGPVRGPDRVEVTISVQYAGQDLPFGDAPADPAPLTWDELAERRTVYTVCVRMPSEPAEGFCSFVTEISARWYAVELARQVRQAGITGMRPQDIFPERPRSPRSDRVLAEEIIDMRGRSGRGMLRLPHRAPARRRLMRRSR